MIDFVCRNTYFSVLIMDIEFIILSNWIPIMENMLSYTKKWTMKFAGIKNSLLKLQNSWCCLNTTDNEWKMKRNSIKMKQFEEMKRNFKKIDVIFVEIFSSFRKIFLSTIILMRVFRKQSLFIIKDFNQ